MEAKYSITFTWDDEASVWIATSDDIFGLILEDKSLDNLIRRIQSAIPELLEAENTFCDYITLDYIVSRQERLSMNG
jgi:predicted RNase H-like HicB family nuclease